MKNNICNTEYKTITCDEAKEMLCDLSCYTTLLDVREPFEFAEKHIKGAVNIPLGQLPEKIAAVFPDITQEIIVYCRSGSRSRDAALYLGCKGYTSVYDLGGIDNWTE
ncbi:MAG: rhodanese-like domain-containing protein [Oscillospiraceae bacterium]|nr:rhodanese-like domain-containing protein [Oscillospiraceae bacterium]